MCILSPTEPVPKLGDLREAKGEKVPCAGYMQDTVDNRWQDEAGKHWQQDSLWLLACALPQPWLWMGSCQALSEESGDELLVSCVLSLDRHISSERLLLSAERAPCRIRLAFLLLSLRKERVKGQLLSATEMVLATSFTATSGSPQSKCKKGLEVAEDLRKPQDCQYI